MKVNVNYYGHSVDISPADLVDRLPLDATEEQIREEFQETLAEALEEDPPSYRHDGEDVIQATIRLLAEQKAQADSEI